VSRICGYWVCVVDIPEDVEGTACRYHFRYGSCDRMRGIHARQYNANGNAPKPHNLDRVSRRSGSERMLITCWECQNRGLLGRSTKTAQWSDLKRGEGELRLVDIRFPSFHENGDG
jgi:hypothetical protein